MAKKKKWIFWREASPRTNLNANPAMLAGSMSTETLIRELIQNSADANVNGDVVKMAVTDGMVSTDSVYDFLCLGDLKEHIEGTRQLAKEKHDERRIGPKCESQLKVLESEKLQYFKFSDYGTKGMEGVGKFNSEKALWKLSFENGTSEKGSNSAGGVGVGKNAAFPFSDLHTVLYITRTDAGLGMVGHTTLASSVVGNKKYQTDGNFVAYDGDLDDIVSNDGTDFESIPEEDINAFSNPLFMRESKGSDVIILGTNGNEKLNDKLLGVKVALYAIRNFYVAFYERRIELKVELGNSEVFDIKGETLSDLIDEFVSNADSYDNDEVSSLIDECVQIKDTYKAETDEEHLTKTFDFDGIGKATLYLNKSDNVTKRGWYISRSFGMRTVFTTVRAQKPTFGILCIESKEGSETLLSLESGNHTEYENSVSDELKDKLSCVKRMEKDVKREVVTFGTVDAKTTDIELAGLTTFISLDKDVKTGDEGADTGKPIVSLVTSKPKSSDNKKRKTPSKRSSKNLEKEENGPDQIGPDDAELNHGEGNKEWDHTKRTDIGPGGEGIKAEAHEQGKIQQTYEMERNVSAVFRDVHVPMSNVVDIVGRLATAAYKNIDVAVSAVDEDDRQNKILPAIVSVVDKNTGKILKVTHGKILGASVSQSQLVQLKVTFEIPFASALVEEATVKVTQTRLVDAPKGEVKDESSK